VSARRPRSALAAALGTVEALTVPRAASPRQSRPRGRCRLEGTVSRAYGLSRPVSRVGVRGQGASAAHHRFLLECERTQAILEEVF
jgi:hypothetical protein